MKLFKRKKITLACAQALSIMLASSVVAAEVKDSAGENIEVIEVTGYMASLQKGLIRKRNLIMLLMPLLLKILVKWLMPTLLSHYSVLLGCR